METKAAPQPNHIPINNVKSSQITGIGYEPDTTTLAVEFTSGTVYHYANVPPELCDQLVKAESIGAFFRDEIKAKPEQYPFTKCGTQKE